MLFVQVVVKMKFTPSYFIFVVAFWCCEGSFRCDYQYIPEGDGWFKLHNTPKTWSDANYTCSLEGAELATPRTTEIRTVLLRLMYMYRSTDARMIHVGIRPKDREFINEVVEEPEPMALDDNGIDRRVNQFDKYPYICHKFGGIDIQLNECGTVNDEYKLDNRTGHCYKFHKTHATWSKARKTCIIEGSHLAIINSEDEAQVIRDIFAENPDYSFPPNSVWNDVAFLGFLGLNKKSWVTLDGTPLNETGYDVFSPGEPNNARGDEFCGSVGRNGLLFDDPCTRHLPFICEKQNTDRVCKPRYLNPHNISPSIKRLWRMDKDKREEKRHADGKSVPKVFTLV